MSTGGSSKDGLRQQPQLYLILELLVAVAPLVLVASLLGLPMSASLSVCGHFQKIVYKLHSVPQYLSNP